MIKGLKVFGLHLKYVAGCRYEDQDLQEVEDSMFSLSGLSNNCMEVFVLHGCWKGIAYLPYKPLAIAPES